MHKWTCLHCKFVAERPTEVKESSGLPGNWGSSTLRSVSGEIFCRFLFWQTVSKSQRGSEQAAKRHRGKGSTAFTGIWCCWRNTTRVYLCWKNTSAERSDAAEREVKQEEKCLKVQFRLFPVTLLHSTKQTFKNTAEIWNGRRGAGKQRPAQIWCVLLYVSNYSTSSTTSGLIWAESSASERIWAEYHFDSEVSNF